MAEDVQCTKNKKIGVQNETVQAIGNSWIICRSQSHPGRIYYFNTYTGKSVWNLSNGELAKAQLFPRESVSGTHMGDCPEPSEPPVDSPRCSTCRDIQPKNAGARIYNKQIINNKFSKAYALPGFNNDHCPCSSLNTLNNTSVNVNPAYNPAVWVMPPHQQVLLASAAAVLATANQAQPSFNSPQMPIQNTSIPFTNFYQMENQSANRNSAYCQAFRKTNFNNHPKCNRKSQRNFPNNSNNDLRDILSARRKNQKCQPDEMREVYESHENLHSEYENAKLTTDDLDPSDVDDEWLEANTNCSISGTWKICSGADCWIVVANAHVMLNNRKFLSKFVEPEEQIYLLTPLEIVKQLRSATGDTESGSRRAQRARCALRFAAQHMDKVPVGLKRLKNIPTEKCCIELIKQNYHVLLLLDDSKLSSQVNMNGVSTFTINKLKEYLNRKLSAWKQGTNENITVTTGQECEASTMHNTEHKNELSSVEHKEIEIQTEEIDKPTVDACIQTDFSEIFTSPIVGEPSQNTQILKMDVVVKSSDKNTEESKVETKKIRLNRQKPNVSSACSPVKKTQFRWRKQRAKPSITTTPPSTDSVVSNNLSLLSKSTPSSLISIGDLIPTQVDNFSDLAKSIAFSDGSFEKTSQIVSKVIDESSVDIISNSIDENETNPEISNNPNKHELKGSENDDIIIFEVTSDLMDDYLSRGCEEWLSRFIQIMEEALSQILQQEPCFTDPDMPPPWSVYEATVCIKRKFKENSKIVFACKEYGNFLLKISDSRGKIFADLNPSNFMRLYSYGVYLIEALQSLLNDSEDLQIAKESLAKLLNDIKNPNLDVAQNVFMDTFLTEKQDHTANVSELDPVAGADLVVAASTLPPKEPEQTPCEPSPSRYNLRSQKSDEQNEQELPEDASGHLNTDESFFSSLRLQKTSSSADSHFPTESILFSPQNTCLPNQNLTGGVKDTKETEMKGPKIIRNFNFDPDIEKKLKRSNQNAYDFGYDDNADDSNCYENECSNDDSYYGHSNDKSDIQSQDQYCTKSDEIGAQIFKFFIERTTYPVHRVLEDLHSFCDDTCQELNRREKKDHLYKKNLIEKTTAIREILNVLRNHLNSALCRKDTKTKVRLMLEELGCMSSEINDTQLSEYEELIQKYIVQATILFESVNLIAAAIREKQ